MAEHQESEAGEMIEKLWILESRDRKRKNGKWSEWEAMDFRDPMSTYQAYPEDQVFSNPYYERRAVEFVRADGQQFPKEEK